MHGPDGRVTEMSEPFDIFKVEENGSVRWIRAIVDLEGAKLCVQKVLAITAPADYLILNQRSGERIIIKTVTQPLLHVKIPLLIASSRN
jgi:hypothetical protein